MACKCTVRRGLVVSLCDNALCIRPAHNDYAWKQNRDLNCEYAFPMGLPFVSLVFGAC